MIESKSVRVQGLEVDAVTLSNEMCKAVLTNLGARLLELHVPDKDRRFADIVLQRPSFEDMAADDHYMGSTVGCYANRIRRGQLKIDDRPVQLSLNEGGNHLHGGGRGFDRRIWSTEVAADGGGVTFWRISPNGEEGYPGTLTSAVTYRLDRSALSIDMRATTDVATVVNLAHHSYFNLGGHGSGTILGHLVKIRSSFYLPVDDELLPTGDVLAVEGTRLISGSPPESAAICPRLRIAAQVGTLPGADLCWALVALWDALEANDGDRIGQIQGPLCAIVSALPSLDSFVVVAKHLLHRQQVISAPVVRGPVGYELDAVTEREVDRMFDRLARAVNVQV